MIYVGHPLHNQLPTVPEIRAHHHERYGRRAEVWSEVTGHVSEVSSEDETAASTQDGKRHNQQNSHSHVTSVASHRNHTICRAGWCEQEMSLTGHRFSFDVASCRNNHCL